MLSSTCDLNPILFSRLGFTHEKTQQISNSCIQQDLVPIPELFQISKAKKNEKTFEDAMLRKLSKVTDLMSRLDTYVCGEEASRVKKCLLLILICDIFQLIYRIYRCLFPKTLTSISILREEFNLKTTPNPLRCLAAVEKKMELAQNAFDGFSAFRAELEPETTRTEECPS